MTTAKPAGEPRLRWTVSNSFGDSACIYEFGDYAAECRTPEMAHAMVAALNAVETRAAQPLTSLCSRIDSYFAHGGLWNPDEMEHEKVRQLLMDCRDALAAQPGDPPKLTADALLNAGDALADAAGIVSRSRVDNAIAQWEGVRRDYLDALNALLASRSTPAAPAPASTEAPGALAADEIIEETLKYYEFAFEKNWVVEDTLQAIRGLKGKFTLAAPSTEALIAAGDVLAILDSDGDWEEREVKLRAALAATPPALTADEIIERCAKFLEEYPDLGSFAESLSPKWVSENSALMRDALSTAADKMRSALKGTLPAARPGGEGTLSRLRKAVDACIYAGSRLNSLAESLVIEHRVSHQAYDASNVMSADWEAAKTDLCALLAELERPGDLPSV